MTRDSQPSRSDFSDARRCLFHRDRHKVKARFTGSPVVRFYGSVIALFRDRPWYTDLLDSHFMKSSQPAATELKMRLEFIELAQANAVFSRDKREIKQLSE